MSTPNKLEISDAWLNFIGFVQREIPFGEIKIKIVNGDPIEPIEWKRKIRFDRIDTIPVHSIAGLEG